MNTYRTPLQPKPGARATRTTPQPERRLQRPTNKEWFEMRQTHTRADFLEAVFGRLLEKVKR
jgi:hypothetical protein